MNKTTGPSQLDARLTQAQELMARGKQRHALDEMWKAEALARGNPEAIRELSDFTTAFAMEVGPSQTSALADLIDALENDAKQTRAPGARPSATGHRSTLAGLGILVLVCVGVVAGAAVGFAVGLRLDNPDSGGSLLDLELGASLGAAVGMLVGGIALPLVALLLARMFRAGRNRAPSGPSRREHLSDADERT
jgi:hypothetical protein